VIYLLSVAGAERLDPVGNFNFDPTCASRIAAAEILHFYGTYRFHDGLYPRLAAGVAASLKAARPRTMVPAAS
jgi:hypothetical protein